MAMSVRFESNKDFESGVNDTVRLISEVNTNGGSHDNTYGTNADKEKKEERKDLSTAKEPPGSSDDSAKDVCYKNEITSTVFSCFGNIAHGMAYGLASPAVPQLLATNALTEYQASWFESLLVLGAMFGGFAVGPMINSLGRKGTILSSGVPFIIGWMCIACSSWYVSLYAGRILTGIAYGIVQVACPVYIAETVSKEIRGSMGMGVVLGQTSGTLLQYSLGLYLETRWLAVISMVPVVVMLVGMTFMPESPRWLIRDGQRDKAFRNLQWLRMSSEAEAIEEFNEMEANIPVCTVTWAELYHELPSAVRPLAICTMLFIFQQFSGITPIMFNAQWILDQVPSVDQSVFGSGQIPAVILAAVKMATTVCGLLLIDRIGRRPLFISCGIAMTISLAILGIYFYLEDRIYVGSEWLPLVTLILFVSAYSVAWGGIPWVIISELPPLKMRGLASGLGSTGAWVSAFIVTQDFITWSHHLHLYGVFWLFGTVCLLGTLFAAKFLPETKLRSLEELENDLTISLHT